MTSGSAKDKAKGKAKEAMGKMTGDRSKKVEGKTDQAKGQVKGAVHHAGESVKGVKDSLKHD
ncbi:MULTISPECIES: CsbD family protein [Streptomyces]|uniref:CsbD family protein n=1 Tax=Streptomyces yanii TaxID=78510 RepID=A0ABV5RKI1_9ACTN